MKKSVLAVLIAVSIVSYSYACVMGVWYAGGAACSSSTDYIGDKGDHSAGNSEMTSDYFWCISYQASAASCSSGTLGYAYLAHNGTDTDNAKVHIYTDSTSGTGAPDGETHIGSSGEITCSTDTATPTCTNSTTVGGSVTVGSYYFLCVVTDSTNFDVHRVSSGGTVYYKNVWDYDTVPDPLTSGSWSSASRDWGAYVEIE